MAESQKTVLVGRAAALRHTLETHTDAGPPASREKAKRRVEPGDEPAGQVAPAEPPAFIKKRKE